MLKMTAVALLVATLVACSQVGHRFDISKASQLQPNVTTEQDARHLLGEPVSVTVNPQNGHRLLVWQYAYGTALATGGGAKLAVSFDANGRMIQIVQRAEV